MEIGNQVISDVCSFCSVNKEDILSDSKKFEYVKIRSLIVVILHDYFDYSFPMIGYVLNRNHTSILNLYSKIKYYKLSDKVFSEQCELMFNYYANNFIR